MFEISAYLQQPQLFTFPYQKLVSVLGDQGPSPPPPPRPQPPSPRLPTLKELGTRAAAHGSDRLMNLNRGGFQSLDGAGEKLDAYSADSPPVGPPAVYQLGLTRS